jgi:glycosyltransferase A (GT-A) superfamily protein (DUF2064 family)
LTAQQAAQVHHALLADTLDAARLAGAEDVILLAAPEADGCGMLRSLFPNVTVVAQEGGGLGERMAHALEALLLRFDRALIVGTDAPWADLANAVEATRALAGRQLMLGPAVDGGFWVVGVSATPRDLFRGVPWSAPTTRAITEQAARAAGWDVVHGRESEDADDWPSLLANLHHASPRVRQLVGG